MRIPSKILNRIQQNDSLVIEWAGHRCFYEVIEEWGDSVFWIVNLWIAYYYFGSMFDYNETSQYVVFFASIFLTIPAIVESVTWGSEWHIVCRNVDKGGGTVFKAQGWIGLKMIELDTLKASPDVNEYEGNVLYWIWVKLTNYRMERVKLSSTDNVFLSSNRISPEFSMAISRTKSANSPVKRETSELWFDVDNLAKVVIRGFYNEKRGKELIEQLINQKYYG